MIWNVCCCCVSVGATAADELGDEDDCDEGDGVVAAVSPCAACRFGDEALAVVVDNVQEEEADEELGTACADEDEDTVDGAATTAVCCCSGWALFLGL